MIALDTNVLVRHFAEDDPDQLESAHGLLSSLNEANPGFVSLTVVSELHWVLARSLRLDRDRVHAIFDGLLRSMDIEIEDGESVGEALEQSRLGADFADALIDATSRLYGVSETVTFDREAARRFGWRLLG